MRVQMRVREVRTAVAAVKIGHELLGVERDERRKAARAQRAHLGPHARLRAPLRRYRRLRRNG